jgi:hypothetical protein
MVSAKIPDHDQSERHPKDDTCHEVTALRAGGLAGRPSSSLKKIADLNIVDKP